MTNDDRTCGTAAAGPQAEAFKEHGPRLRTAITHTARGDPGMLATERRRNHGRHGPHVVKDRLCPAATGAWRHGQRFPGCSGRRWFPFYLMLLLPVWRSSTPQADDPSMPAVRSQAGIHTSSRHRAERRKSHANRLGPRPRRAHSVSSRNQYGRIELRGAASSVSAQAIFLPGTAGTSRRCSCSPPSISAAAHDDQLSVAERCDLSIVLRTLS